MQVMKWSVIALAVAAGTSQLAFASAQSESNGFIEDSSFNVLSRALYMNRDYRNGGRVTNPGTGKTSGYYEETGLGLRGMFESGFTQGTVGFGIDAHTLTSIKLDTGRGRTRGEDQFALDSNGRPEDTQSEIGGAVKVRISNTVLKYGNQIVDTPVFSTDDSRILPEVATGTLLTSSEITGLKLTAGRFSALNSQFQTGRDSIDYYYDGGLKSANILGASYSFTDNFSGAVYASDVEDYWKKKYLNLNYTLPLAEEQSLNFDLNAYRTTGEGQELGGEVDNKIWSLAAAYSIGAHTFTIAHQRSTGDAGYNYGLDGGGAIYLANSVQISDFEKKDERSWKAQYNLNMAAYGVPGLSFMTRYVTGDNIDLGNGRDGKEHEFNIESKYVIQEGAAKDLSFRVRHAILRGDTGVTTDRNDFRVIVEYPLSIL